MFNGYAESRGKIRLSCIIDISEINNELIERLYKSAKIAILSGSGISVAAGLDTFSGINGQQLWEYNLIYELLSAEKGLHLKIKQQRFLDSLLIKVSEAQPTVAHTILANFANQKDLKIITENFDNLHEKSGIASENITAIYGRINYLRCDRCNNLTLLENSYKEALQRNCYCGGKMRTDLIMFDEMIDRSLWYQAEQIVKESDCLLIIGSSGQLLPVSLLPAMAHKQGCFVIELNLEPTDITAHCDITILGDCQQTLAKLLNMN